MQLLSRAGTAYSSSQYAKIFARLKPHFAWTNSAVFQFSTALARTTFFLAALCPREFRHGTEAGIHSPFLLCFFMSLSCLMSLNMLLMSVLSCVRSVSEQRSPFLVPFSSTRSLLCSNISSRRGNWSRSLGFSHTIGRTRIADIAPIIKYLSKRLIQPTCATRLHILQF